MSRSVLILSTHFLNEGILREYEKMKRTPNVDAVLMIDNSSKTYEWKERIETRTFFGIEATCFFFDADVHDELKLPYFPVKREKFGTLMWWNADYRFYYFRHYFPDYEYYWLIEYDVFFNSTDRTYSAFLKKYDGSTADFIGPKPATRKLGDYSGSQKVGWIYKDHVHATVFPLIRLSAKAIDFLCQRRLEHAKIYEETTGEKRWVYVEVFVPTELKLNGSTFSETKEPNVKPAPLFSLNDQRIFEKPDDLMYHPVKTIQPDLLKEIASFHEFRKNLLRQEEMMVAKAQYAYASMSAYRLAIHGSQWFLRQSVALGEENVHEVSWNFLLVLYRFLDEYRPTDILEMNLGQASKMVAQYASKFHVSHTLLEHDRDRTLHFMRCWDLPWDCTTIHGSPILRVNHNSHGDHIGVIFQNFDKYTAGKRYDLILMKCPALDRELYIHLDLLTKLPDILSDDFAILMDHTEDPFGCMVLDDIESLLKDKEVEFLRKDFAEPDRRCSILASKSRKYIMEF